jgi:hypothetical protein
MDRQTEKCPLLKLTTDEEAGQGDKDHRSVPNKRALLLWYATVQDEITAGPNGDRPDTRMAASKQRGADRAPRDLAQLP